MAHDLLMNNKTVSNKFVQDQKNGMDVNMYQIALPVSLQDTHTQPPHFFVVKK